MTLPNAIALLLTLIPFLSAQPDRFGTPACSGADAEFADRTYFILCHSASLKTPIWVGYELKPEHLTHIACRSSHFRRDEALSHPGALDSDYKGSGFTRGHMAPAADFAWSDHAMRATFVLSNAVPQKQGVNAGRWSQVEAAVRRIAAVSDAVYVFTGPVFDSPAPEVIGVSRVAVPSHTYKVIMAVRGDRKTMYAAIIPNGLLVRDPLDYFVTTVDEVQRRTGLDFFSALDDAEEQRLESTLQHLPVH